MDKDRAAVRRRLNRAVDVALVVDLSEGAREGFAALMWQLVAVAERLAGDTGRTTLARGEHERMETSWRFALVGHNRAADGAVTFHVMDFASASTTLAAAALRSGLTRAAWAIRGVPVPFHALAWAAGNLSWSDGARQLLVCVASGPKVQSDSGGVGRPWWHWASGLHGAEVLLVGPIGSATPESWSLAELVAFRWVAGAVDAQGPEWQGTADAMVSLIEQWQAAPPPVLPPVVGRIGWPAFTLHWAEEALSVNMLLGNTPASSHMLQSAAAVGLSESGLLEEVPHERLVDIVLVVDLSDRMKPCIDNLAVNLHAFVTEVAHDEACGSPWHPIKLDWRIGFVGHHSVGNGGVEFLRFDLTDQDHPTDVARVREILDQCGGMLQHRPATLHAMDWAMDNISWRGPGGYRRVLAVFTDEPIGGGDMAGVSEASWRDFMTKLFGFNVFLVAPLDSDPTPVFSFTRIKNDMPSWLKGSQHVNGPRPEDWYAIDWTSIFGVIRGLTRGVGEVELPSTATRHNVFDLRFPPAQVVEL